MKKRKVSKELAASITAAEASVAEAERKLELDRALLEQLYVKRSKELFGIEAGMMVRVEGVEYLVDSVVPDSYVADPPWLNGRKIRKNGTPVFRTTCIYRRWEIVK